MKKSNDERSLDMFNIPQMNKPAPGMANYSVQASARLAAMLKKATMHGKDRDQIVCELNRLTGLDVSKSTLDKWASISSVEHNAPFYLVPVLEAICEETDLCDWHAEIIGGKVSYGLDTLNTQLGKLETLRADMDRRIKEIQKVMEQFDV